MFISVDSRSIKKKIKKEKKQQQPNFKSFGPAKKKIMQRLWIGLDWIFRFYFKITLEAQRET